MAKKMDKPRIPDVNHLAQAIYDENYKNAYKSKVTIYPHITGLLKELAKVEAQLEVLAMKDAALQSAGVDIFMIEQGKATHMHPHRKLEKELRSSQNKLVKALNLSLEKKAAMKAERDAQLDDLDSRL